MLEDATGVKATYIGKPSQFIFNIALESMGVESRRVLMVGDRVATDIMGAKKAGIKSVLVKTGEFKESDLSGDIQPDFIIKSLKGIEGILQVSLREP